MNTVLGRNVIVSMYVVDGYYPVFCCKDAEFSMSQDEIETTSVNSGTSREYTAGMMSATLTVSGVTTLDNTNSRVSVTYLMQQSVRRQVREMMIVLTDDDSNDIVITFNAIITTTGFSRNTNGYSQSNVGFRVTGNILFDTVIPPPVPETVFSDYFPCTGGSSSISDVSLQGVTILMVARSGDVHEETTGTPGNHEFKYTTGTGDISFDTNNPFNTGEVIYVEWKT